MPIKDAALFAAQHDIFAIQMVRGQNFGVYVQETSHINPHNDIVSSSVLSVRVTS